MSVFLYVSRHPLHSVAVSNAPLSLANQKLTPGLALSSSSSSSRDQNKDMESGGAPPDQRTSAYQDKRQRETGDTRKREESNTHAQGIGNGHSSAWEPTQIQEFVTVRKRERAKMGTHGWTLRDSHSIDATCASFAINQIRDGVDARHNRRTKTD